MTDDKVNRIEENLRNAQLLIENSAKLLCNEPGDTVGGEIYTFLCKKAQEVVAPLNLTYKLRDWD